MVKNSSGGEREEGKLVQVIFFVASRVGRGRYLSFLQSYQFHRIVQSNYHNWNLLVLKSPNKFLIDLLGLTIIS
jgi:hypothetical protein